MLAWYLYPFVQNWKCRTSTEGTKVPRSPWASSIATLYHPPVGNEELRLSFLLAHCIANGEKRSYLVFAHFLCRSLLAVCLSTIPAAKVLLILAGLESPLPVALWHLSTALGVAWARQVTLLGQGHMSFDVLLFLCLYFARKCGLPAKAHSAMQSRSKSLLQRGKLKEGCFCRDPQLYS